MGSIGLKVCGVTRAEDYRACVDLGVDAVGINLWGGSKRHMTLRAADDLVREAADGHAVLRVGVFVDPSADEIAQAQSRLELDLIQLHGDAPIDRYAALGYPYVWVIRGTPDLSRLEPPSRPPRWVLLDGLTPGFGGAGQRTDWAWARTAVEHLAPLPVWLAGGLDPANADEAISTVRPAGIDVASGAELDGADHGQKDAGKIAALVAICKNRGSP